MSTTIILRCWKNENDTDDTENMVELAKQLGRIEYEDRFTLRTGGSSFASNGGSTFNREIDFDGDDIKFPKQRNVLNKINKNVKKKRAALAGMSVNYAFQRRFNKLQTNLEQTNEENPIDMDSIQKKLFGKNVPGFVTQQKTMAALKTLHKQSVQPGSNPRPSANFSTAAAVHVSETTRRNNTSIPDYLSTTSGAGIANTQNVQITRRKQRKNVDVDDEPNHNNNNGNAPYNYMGELYKYRSEKTENGGDAARQANALPNLPEEDYD